ncbi:sigma-70 family RNA polymerase sigma factor [Paenibacillus sp. NEAU-GSW1]|nr:sigma-70 family RNA polymerase sigma factor [Paenibacillus sp. NEAU-GSW1]
MYQIAKAILKKDEDCADAMQETVPKAYQAIPKLKQPAFFKTWLFRILINECNRIYRRRVQVMESIDRQQEGFSAHADLRLDLQEAVYRLDEASRNVILLHYFRDLPIRQVAELLDLSEGAVKTRLHRARHQLSEWLNENDEGGIEHDLSCRTAASTDGSRG